MTTSTSGKSSPLAATSVARRTAGEVGRPGKSVKLESVFVRVFGGRCPCKENKVVFAGRKGLKIWHYDEYFERTRKVPTHTVEIVNASAGGEVYNEPAGLLLLDLVGNYASKLQQFLRHSTLNIEVL